MIKKLKRLKLSTMSLKSQSDYEVLRMTLVILKRSLTLNLTLSIRHYSRVNLKKLKAIFSPVKQDEQKLFLKCLVINSLKAQTTSVLEIDTKMVLFSRRLL